MAVEPGQNAPLGRAVIGGLLFATCATLFFVPTMFSFVHARDRQLVEERLESLAAGPTQA
jgi:Cu/Ag efflux pump CusA